jgi:DNA ligase-1
MGLTHPSKYSAQIQFDDPRFDGVDMAADWIRDLESSDSRLHKERVVEKALMAARLGSASAQGFLYNCYLALNPFFVYGVKKVPESAGLTDRDNPWTAFWGLCESLRTRSVTGGDARQAIADMMLRFDSEQWNGLARRVLIKDLRCGVSEKTINKICGKTEYAIPVFTCQLAQDSGDHPAKMQGTKRLEVKLDGVRVLAMCYVRSGTVNLMSRNGKAFTNFGHIEQQLMPHIKRISMKMFNTGADFVLDGEIVGESFQALMRQAQRKKDADAADSIYHVFDIMPMEDFYRGYWNAQQHKRLTKLESVRDVLAEYCPAIQIMPGMTVDLNGAEGHDVLRRFADASVEQGYEGIMIKDLDAPYECKRSSFWMKWKPTITVDLNIVGTEEGTGRNQGRLGALICEGVDNGRDIRVNVGSGLRDSDRDEFWKHRSDLLARVVEVEADAVTQNQDGTYSLRFPRFVRFRGWEAGEKI